MTREGHRQLAADLARWFKDRDVSLADAAIAIGMLLSTLIGRMAQDEACLDQGIEDFKKAIDKGARRIFGISATRH